MVLNFFFKENAVFTIKGLQTNMIVNMIANKE